MPLPTPKVSREDTDWIDRIVERAVEEGLCPADLRAQLAVDLATVHANWCVLNLRGLLCTFPSEFANDIRGIRANFDPSTGQLSNGFLPRNRQQLGFHLKPETHLSSDWLTPLHQ